MDNKVWYTSKTLWWNALVIVGIIIQAVTGKEIIDPEAQVLILGVINFILRLVTKQPIGW